MEVHERHIPGGTSRAVPTDGWSCPEKIQVQVYFAAFQCLYFERIGNHGERKSDKTSRQKINQILIVFNHNHHHKFIQILYLEMEYRGGNRGKNSIFSMSIILHSAFALSFVALSLFFSFFLCTTLQLCRATKRFTEGNGGASLSGSLHQPATKLILNPGQRLHQHLNK